MKINLSMLEKLNIEENLKTPHLSYVIETIRERKRVALLCFQKKETEIFLINSSGFLIDSVFAGLTEKHIEYISKNAPRDYKVNILKLLRDQEMVKGVFEIARAMDEDLGEKITKNQERVRNVIQYIKDNRMVFEF